MTIFNLRNSLLLATFAFLATPAEAQYGYGYNTRSSGWRNIYIVAIVVPIVLILLCILFWFCIFRAIFRRRRESRSNYALPQQQSYAPQSSYNSGPQYAAPIQPPPMMHQPSNNYGNYNGASYPGGTMPSQYAPPTGPPPKSKWRM